MDDLWAEDVWGIISRAFPGGYCCSRLITTTQIKGVALACCGHQSNNVFKMEPLSAAQSTKLFFRTVFGSEFGCPRDLKEVSEKIVRKCGGLPLACINIASMLPSTLNLEEWTGILDSLPSTCSTEPSSEWMKEVVTLMYTTLRPHLKTCLLCFSMYPEGCIVRKDDLVKQWVLEGFLDGATKAIVGDYFDELVKRGMIQPVNTNNNGEVLSCTLHRTIHDVIVSKSMEENFVTTVDYFQSSIALPDNVRRLSVQLGGARSAHIPDNIVVSKLRSLVFFGLFQCLPSIDEYSLLRVLILHIWADQDKDSIDLTGIHELLRLRYLKIACNIPVNLPDEIQGQQDLEILDVDATLAAIPWDIGELSKLRTFKFAVTELSTQDICVLQELVALTSLSVYVKTAPTETIVIGKGGFCDLKFFTFRCSAPLLLIEECAMQNIEKLNLCFNAHKERKEGKKPIIIGYLASLPEISVSIWGPVADDGSSLVDMLRNDSRNRIPVVKFKRGTLEEHDDLMEEDNDETSQIQDDGSGKDEHTEADTSRKPFMSDTSVPSSDVASFTANEGSSSVVFPPEMNTEATQGKPQESVLSKLPQELSFNFLEKITNGFSPERELGRGAFGTVYMGILNDGAMIAVKKHKAQRGTLEKKAYRYKFQSIVDCKHDNVVKLLAFCHEERNNMVGNIVTRRTIESFFCYEYCPNGNLGKHIFGVLASNIGWDERFNIIKGICQGLEYLHEKHIIHLNLKPQNILLDRNMDPKITDFMYSRIFGETTTCDYTINEAELDVYKAPEYLRYGKISVKTDIYALGLMILEITTGEESSASKNVGSTEDYIAKVKEHWNGNKSSIVRRLRYPILCSQGGEEIEACINFGLTCVSLEENHRPTIKDIVRNLGLR